MTVANRPADTLGHSSIQAWSAGPIFPAVIAKIERYSYLGASHPIVTAAERLDFTCYELTLDGHSELYAAYEDAEQVARALLADPEVRAQWSNYEEV